MSILGTPADTSTERPVRPPKPPAPRWSWVQSLGVAFIVVALVIGAFSVGRFTADEATTTTVTTTTQAETVTPTLPAAAEPVAAVAAALTPSMVQIQTDYGLGSGVIYDSSGLILTAAHVVGNSERVLIQLADGNRVQGTVVGADAASDIAVVEVDAPDLVPAPLALDGDLQPGQMAIAIGSPFGLDQTVTAGVISSVSRAIVGSDGVVRDLIQTDAPINPGNSGGALADRLGRVIGINDQIFSTSGGNEGVGFAIPIPYAKEIADKLVAGETIETPILGVTGTDPTLGRAGALITGVQPGSAAAAAGLETGDLIVAVDGEPIQSFAELAGEIRAHEPGDTIRLSVQRGNDVLDVDAALTTG